MSVGVLVLSIFGDGRKVGVQLKTDSCGSTRVARVGWFVAFVHAGTVLLDWFGREGRRGGWWARVSACPA